jgi:hypothetical protein
MALPWKKHQRADAVEDFSNNCGTSRGVAKREAHRIEQWIAVDDDYAVGEFQLGLHNWKAARRFVVVRERIRETRGSVGRKLIDVPG